MAEQKKRRKCMKRRMGILMIVASVFMLAQGCSDQTQGDMKELGSDLERDVNDAARKIDNKVQDAVD
jgi:hypothetical protein